MSKSSAGIGLVAALGAGYLVAASADAGRVEWPAGYASSFVRYHSVDKPKERGPAKVRFFYVNPDALAAARPGAPLPEGTVLVMEDHPARLDADGEPIVGLDGRFVPLPEVTNVFVQEKRGGWGEAFDEAIRNGDWDYAWFLADGTRKPDAKFDGCFACHKKSAGPTADFNFTFGPFVQRIKQGSGS